MKTIGIIGGLGPSATSNFYQQLTKKAAETGTRPEIIIVSLPMDLSIEEKFIKNQNGSNYYKQALSEAAIKLEQAGADFITIPCNSVHIFWKEISDSVTIPVLNLVNLVKKYLANHNYKRIGLLATPVTLDSSLYANSLEKEGFELILPKSIDKKLLGVAINRVVQDSLTTIPNELNSALMEMEQDKPDAILSACTDLQASLLKNKIQTKIIDSTEILLKATLNQLH